MKCKQCKKETTVICLCGLCPQCGHRDNNNYLSKKELKELMEKFNIS